jgi:hypothetical protein
MVEKGPRDIVSTVSVTLTDAGTHTGYRGLSV